MAIPLEDSERPTWTPAFAVGYGTKGPCSADPFSLIATTQHERLLDGYAQNGAQRLRDFVLQCQATWPSVDGPEPILLRCLPILAALVAYDNWAAVMLRTHRTCHLKIARRDNATIDRFWRACESNDECSDAIVPIPMSVPTWTADNVGGLIEYIRKLHASAFEPDERETLQWIQCLSNQKATMECVSVEAKRGQFGNVAYASKQMVLALLMSDCLRDRAKLKRVIAFAVSYVLDAPTAKHINDMLSAKVTVPSAPTLSRHQLCVHAAWLLRMRCRTSALLRAGIIFNAMADGSPVGYKDWLNIFGSVTLKRKLGFVLMRAHRFVRSSRTPDALKSVDELEEETADAAYLTLQRMPLYVPPVAMGSKRTSMPYRFHAMTHALYLICYTWALTCQLLNSMGSLVTDLGTEKLLPRFPSCSIARLFPWASDGPDANPALAPPPLQLSRDNAGCAARQQASNSSASSTDAGDESLSVSFGDLDDIGDSDDGGGGSDSGSDTPETHADGNPTINVSKVLHVPGPQHIVHNATKDLKRVMLEWDWFILGLTHICRLIQKPFSRDRFFEQCCPPEVVAWIQHNVDLLCMRVYEGRWGTICAAILELSKLAAILPAHWHLARYNFKADDAAADATKADPDVCDPNVADEYIRSPKFWAYRAMMQELVGVLDHFLHWCEACPCHRAGVNGYPTAVRRAYATEDYSASQRTRYFKRRYDLKKCPLSGCRASDLALHRWKTVVDRLFNTASIAVDLAVPANVSVEDRATIVHDFSYARDHLQFSFDLKFIAWLHLPLKICGIADPNEAEARRCGAQCIVLYEQCEHKDALHPLAKALLRAGAELRRQLLLFVRGLDLSDASLPRLRHFLGRFTLVITCERAVEAMHARLRPPSRN